MRAKLVILVAMLSVAGCGGGSDEDQIREAATDFTVAFADGDMDRVCELMTGEAKRKLVALGRGSCEQVMGLAGDAMDDAERDRLRDAEVTKVTIDGDRAEVVQTSGSETVDPLQLAKRGDEWLVDADQSSASTEEPSPPEGDETPPASPATVKQGEPLVMDGYEVKVTAVERAREIDGTEATGPIPAEGEFVILSLEVRNRGTERAMFNAPIVQVVDAGGTAYESQDGAAQGQYETLPDALDERQVEPNGVETGKVAFDVPAGTDIVKAQFAPGLVSFSEDFPGVVTLE
jgi:hypothetical protein